MTQIQTDPAVDTADAVLKTRHRALWALGDYSAVAAEVIAPLGPRLVRACMITSQDHVLDVAAGSGNAAIPAAALGATVVASDLTPELLDAGAAAAATQGLTLSWHVADAESLPYADGDFDVAMSCVGVMFAPHHQAGADELVRVVRPGGRIGLLSWTPAGFVGEMFSIMKPYAPAPPPGTQPPPRWGDPDHLTELFGDRVSEVEVVRETLVVDHFASGEAFRDFFKRCYGPTISTYRAIANDPARVAELDRALADLGRRHDRGDGTMEWEYLLWTSRRA